jgi:hypothetical protein
MFGPQEQPRDGSGYQQAGDSAALGTFVRRLVSLGASAITHGQLPRPMDRRAVQICAHQNPQWNSTLAALHFVTGFLYGHERAAVWSGPCRTSVERCSGPGHPKLGGWRGRALREIRDRLLVHSRSDR